MSLCYVDAALDIRNLRKPFAGVVLLLHQAYSSFTSAVSPSCKCSRCKSAIKWSSRMPAACHRPFTGPSLLACAIKHKALVASGFGSGSYCGKSLASLHSSMRKKYPSVVSPTSPVLLKIFLITCRRLIKERVFDRHHFIWRFSLSILSLR